MFYITDYKISIKGLKVEDKITFAIEENMNNNRYTTPKTIKRDCGLGKVVYNYIAKLKEQEKIDTEYEGIRYRNIILTKRGLAGNEEKREFLRSLLDH